jgi:hypothetical protein
VRRSPAAIVLPLAAVLGAALSAFALPAVDTTRDVRTADQALLFVPDPGQLKLAAMGFEEPLASLFWVRTVLVFGDRFDTESGDQWTLWMRRMVQAVNTLDPTWRTAYFYGGTLLRVLGDIEGSDAVFQDARTNLPRDWFFPFSLGMNAYLYRDDPATAARYLADAALLPGAPSWYAAAAAAMQQKSGQRAAGIQFLQEVRASTDNPAIRADAERQLGRLRHNALVEQWIDACRRYREEHHAPLPSPQALAELGFPLPPNPREDAWVVGRDGVVRSAGAEQERRKKTIELEFRLVGR